MKCRPSTIQNIANLWEKYLSARFPEVLKDIKDDPMKEASSAALWVYWGSVTDEIRIDDSSPRFKNRKRVLDFNWNFPLYPDDTNDTTLETALKAAYKLLAAGKGDASKAVSYFE